MRTKIAIVTIWQLFACSCIAADLADVPVEAVRILGAERTVQHAWAPCLSRDERSVVVAKLDEASDRKPDEPVRQSQLWIVNSDGSNARPVTRGAGFKDSPVFDPAGEEIAFVKDGGELWFIRSDGTEAKKAAIVAGKLWEPAWAPDGDTLAFVLSGSESGIGFYDRQADELITVISMDMQNESMRPHGLTWSPGSDRIWFIFDRQLCFVDVESRELHFVQMGDKYALSSDGKSIACSWRDKDLGLIIDIISTETLRQRRLFEQGDTAAQFYGPLVWSPAGKKLICGRVLFDVATGRYTDLRRGIPPESMYWALDRYYWQKDGAGMIGESEVITAARLESSSRQHYQNHGIWFYSIDWNSLLTSKKTVKAELSGAIDTLAGSIETAYAELLFAETTHQPAATRLVCTAILEDIYDRMVELACTKHPGELANVIRLTDRHDYDDPLTDGANWGFLRRLKSLDPLTGEFIRMDMGHHEDAGNLIAAEHVFGYPVPVGLRQFFDNKTAWTLGYLSTNQKTNVSISIMGSNALRTDVRALLVDVLRPFFALELLYDAQKLYDIKLGDSFRKVQRRNRQLAATRRQKRRANPAASNLAEFGWPKRHGDLGNTGYVEGKVSRPFELKWKKSLGGRAEWMSPVLDREYLYVCLTEPANGDNVYVLDPATGDSIAAFEIDGGAKATPVLSRNRVYLCHDERKISAFEKGTWKKVWTSYTGRACGESSLTLADGILINTNRDGYITAIDAVDGGKIWQRSITDVSGEPAIIERKVIYADGDRMVARDIENGRLLWEHESPYGRSAYRAAVCCGDGKAFGFFVKDSGGSYTGRFCALDVDTGELAWKHRIDNYGISSPHCVDKTVIVRGDRCYGLDVRTGRFQWTAPVGAGSFAMSGVVVERNMLVSGGHCVVDVTTGQMLERRNLVLDDQVTTSPAFYRATLYMLDTKGNVYAFD
jgi:outer membrane protein assembly factor BamB